MLKQFFKSLFFLCFCLCWALPLFAQPIVPRQPLVLVAPENLYEANELIVEPPTEPDQLSDYSEFLQMLEDTYNITIQTRSLNPSGVGGKVIESHFWEEDLGAETTAEICNLYNSAGYKAYLSYFGYLTDLEVVGEIGRRLYRDEPKPDFEPDLMIENQLPYALGNDNSSFPNNDGGYLRAHEALWPPDEEPKETVLLVLSDTGLLWQHPDFITNLWQNPGEDLDGDGTIVDLGNGQYELDPDDLDGQDSDGNGYNDLMGWNFWHRTEDPSTGSGTHGTLVYSIVGSQTYNGIGIAGLLFPGYVKIVPTKIGDGLNIELDQCIEGIYYASYLVAQGYKLVLNMSWVCWEPNQPALQEALEIFSSFGGGAVASAGNWGGDFPRPPASYENVIAVTASNINNVKAYFSAEGDWCDIAAPGEDIFAYYPVGYGYGWHSGTSYSAPFVAAAAAMYWSIHPDLTWAQVREKVLSAVYQPEDYPSGPYYGAGILDTWRLFNQ